MEPCRRLRLISQTHVLFLLRTECHTEFLIFMQTLHLEGWHSTISLSCLWASASAMPSHGHSRAFWGQLIPTGMSQPPVIPEQAQHSYFTTKWPVGFLMDLHQGSDVALSQIGRALRSNRSSVWVVHISWLPLHLHCQMYYVTLSKSHNLSLFLWIRETTKFLWNFFHVQHYETLQHEDLRSDGTVVGCSSNLWVHTQWVRCSFNYLIYYLLWRIV